MEIDRDKKLKVLLLGASFSTRNMGVAALAAGAVKCIKKRYPRAEVSLLDYGRQYATFNLPLNGGNVLIRLINLRFSKKIYLRNNIAYLIFLSLFLKILPFERLRAAVIRGNPYLSQICSADMAVALSGGDSFSDLYGIKRFIYVTLPQILVILLGKKLILLPQTIGPFKGGFARAVARFVLDKAAAVYTREKEGVEDIKALISQIGSAGKVRFCFDVGFVLDPIRPECKEFDASMPSSGCGRPVAGLNVSGLLRMGGYTRSNMFGFKTGYAELLRDIVAYLANVKNADVVLIPHVFGGMEHEESDVAACEEVYAKMEEPCKGRLHILRGEYDQSGIKYAIGRCDFFIGSRMHSCIAAVSQNVPTVSVSYSKKFKGVMESVGAPLSVADPRTMSTEEILSIIGDSFDRRMAIKKALEERMPGIRQTVLGLFYGV